jgi:hypothetical protein
LPLSASPLRCRSRLLSAAPPRACTSACICSVPCRHPVGHCFRPFPASLSRASLQSDRTNPVTSLARS